RKKRLNASKSEFTLKTDVCVWRLLKQEFSWPLFDVCMLTYQTVVRSGAHLDTVDHDQLGQTGIKNKSRERRTRLRQHEPNHFQVDSVYFEAPICFCTYRSGGFFTTY